ncbi:MAG: DUF2892 domain-containing protein [Armatimonadota bacterium]|nr:DUF2892 domain-containing protein [Armatimonadota bacterium]
MKLNKNMGTLDRIIRLVIAAVIAVLYFTGNLSGLAAIILGILAVAFVVTSLVGFCPTYLPFGLSTRKQ